VQLSIVGKAQRGIRSIWRLTRSKNKEISVKKSLRNLVLSSSVLVLSAGSLHAGVTGGAPEPKTGRLAVVISIVLVTLGLG
jgi:hypothetical protein